MTVPNEVHAYALEHACLHRIAAKWGIVACVHTVQYPHKQCINSHSFSAPVKVLKVHDHVVSICCALYHIIEIAGSLQHDRS